MDSKVYADFIKAIELNSISLADVSLKKHWLKLQKIPDKPTFELSYKTEKLQNENNVLIFRTMFSINGVDTSNPEGTEKLFDLAFAIDLTYVVSKLESEPIDPQQMEEIESIFKNRNVPLNCWPYAREFISSTTIRMGFPSLVIGTFKFGI